MFQSLKEQPADKILALMQKYKEDPRESKIDLGVGVYKNAEGLTPVMRAVKRLSSNCGNAKQRNPMLGWSVIRSFQMSWLIWFCQTVLRVAMSLLPQHPVVRVLCVRPLNC